MRKHFLEKAGKTCKKVRSEKYGYECLVPFRCSISIFYAVWFCNGGNRFHQSEKCRKHHYEESDGLLYWNSRILRSWLRYYEQ